MTFSHLQDAISEIPMPFGESARAELDAMSEGLFASKS